MFVDLKKEHFSKDVNNYIEFITYNRITLINNYYINIYLQIRYIYIYIKLYIIAYLLIKVFFLIKKNKKVCMKFYLLR